MACDFICLKNKGLLRLVCSQYIVNVVGSRKWSKMESLLLQTTNSQ